MKNIFLFIAILFFHTGVWACSFPERSDLEIFEDASRVFRAKIIATNLVTETIAGDKAEIIRVTYKLLESYKGKNPESDIVRELPFGPGNCMIGLMTGMEYIIFIDNEYNFVTLSSGSWGYLNISGTEVVPRIEKLRKLANRQ